MLPSITGPDSNGTITEIIYRVNNNNQNEKVTRTYKPTHAKADHTGFINSLRRQNQTCKPFGAALKGNLGCTLLSQDDVFIEDPTINKKDDTITILKNNLVQNKLKRLRKERVKTTKSITAKYVPPHRGVGHVMEEEPINQLRVSNLSTDAFDNDVRELFGHFGTISRVYIAKNHDTGKSRGFGFVTYHHRKDAEAALHSLNGYGYDYLILKVDWAEKRKLNSHYSGYGKPLPQTAKK